MRVTGAVDRMRRALPAVRRHGLRVAVLGVVGALVSLALPFGVLPGATGAATAAVVIPTCWTSPSGAAPASDPDTCSVTQQPADGGAGSYTITITHHLSGQRCADFGTWPVGCVASEYAGMGTGDTAQLACPFYSGPASGMYFAAIDSSNLPETSFTCTVTLNFDGLNAAEEQFTDNDWQAASQGTVFFLGIHATPPTAAINYHATGTAANQWVFDGSPSSPGTGSSSIENYAWNFGDGTSTTVTTPTVTHTFATEGDKTVTLTVTASSGQTATTSTTLSSALAIEQFAHAPTSIGVGAAFTESVTVQNEGPTTITGVTPTVSVADATVASLGGAVTPASASIPPGMSQTFAIGGTGLKSGTTTVSASASGSAGGATITAPTRTASLPVAAAALSISLVNPPSALSTTKPSTLQVLVTALGSQGATGVTVAAPAKTTGSGDGDFQVLSGPTGSDVGFTLPTQGSTRLLTFQLQATTAGAFGYTVGVTGTDTATGAAASASVTGTIASPTLVVTTTGDQALSSDQLATNVCDVDPATAGNQCTLRAALQLAAARGDAETIDFDIPGGTPTIAPATALPAATSPVTIDGTSETGGWVVLSGSADASAAGLTISGGDSTIRGLVINGWATGLQLVGAGGDLVQGDRIGTDPSGTTAVANQTGIRLLAPNSTIGQLTGGTIGDCSGGCNVIAGNTTADIEAGPQGGIYASGSRIVGNVIGADVTGGTQLSTGVGIEVSASTVTVSGWAGATPIQIGGITSRAGLAPGNLIDAKVGFAAASSVTDGTPVTVIIGEGNLFGADWTDSHAVGQQVGVSDVADLSQWGDPAAGAGNVFVFDTVAGADEGGLYVNDSFGVGVSGDVQPDARGLEGSVSICGDEISGNPVGAYGHPILLGGNRIGTDVAGAVAIPNQVGIVGGVLSEAPSGTTAICDSYGPDVISGNTTAGVQPGFGPVVLTHVYIGTNAAGTRAIPNGVGILQAQGLAAMTFDVGVPVTGDSRPCASPCTLISGNTGAGISYAANDPSAANFGSSGNLGRIAIANSGIGVAVDGSPLPNGGGAVSLSGPITADENNTVPATGIVGNTIVASGGMPAIDLSGATLATGQSVDYFPVARNTMTGGGTAAGIALGTGSGFRIASNGFHNVGTAISVASGGEPDLSGNSFTAAQGGYALAAPVARTGTPTGISVARVGSSLIAAGTLTGTRDFHTRIDAYASSTCSAVGADSTAVGSAMLPVGVSSDFSVTSPLPAGQGLQLTATELDGSLPTITSDVGATSLYSTCVSLAALPTLSAASVAAGGSVTLTAPGFVAGESTGLTLHSDPVDLGTALADDTGLVTATVTIPADTAAGLHHILVTDAAGTTVTIPLTVTAAAGTVTPVAPVASASPTALAATGTSLDTPLGAALLLLVIGAAIRTRATLRRRTPRTR